MGLLSAWVGFQAQSLISIDNIGISIWGWLLGGSIVGLNLRHKVSHSESATPKEISKNLKTVEINLFQPAISALVLIPTIIFSSFFYKSESNLFFLSEISTPTAPQNKEKVLEYANKMLDNPFSDPFYKYRTSFFLFDMGYNDKSYEIVSNLHTYDPKNLDYLQGLAYFEEIRKNIPNAISIRNEIVKGDPWNATNYLKLLALYKDSGDLVKATSMKNKILSCAPNTDIAKTALEALG